MNAITTSNQEIKAEVRKEFEVRDKSHKALEKQVGQLAEEMSQMRGSGGRLPSDTTVNPKHQGSNPKNTREVPINKISLRSGRVIDSGVESPPPQLVEGVVEDVSDEESVDGQMGKLKMILKKIKLPPL